MSLYYENTPSLILMRITLWRYTLLSKIALGKERERYRRKLSDLNDTILAYEQIYFANRERTPFDWLFINQQQMLSPPLDGLNQIKRECEVIVSLTTHPPRMKTLWIVLKAMLNQTFKPDKILLYLAAKQFSGRKLPEWVELYREAGVEFIFCEDDLKLHKKYFYAMRDNPDAIVITVDDDVLYDMRSLETLMGSYNIFPHATSSMRVGETAVGEDGGIQQFSERNKICMSRDLTGKPSMRHLLIGLGGVLFPPYSLHREVLNAGHNNIVAKTVRMDNGVKITGIIGGCVLSSIEERQKYYEHYPLEKWFNPVDDWVVYDIGANIGNHTLFFALKKESIKVFAFEPLPVNYDLLCKNLADNGVSGRVAVFNTAVGVGEGAAKMRLTQDMNYGSGSIFETTDNPTNDEQGGDYYEVPLVAIDALNLPNPDFVKIDVEGYGLPVLKGMRRTLIENNPLVWIEVDKTDACDIYNFLVGLGYSVKDILTVASVNVLFGKGAGLKFNSGKEFVEMIYRVERESLISKIWKKFKRKSRQVIHR